MADVANPWEIERANIVYNIEFGGAVHIDRDENGTERTVWNPNEFVRAAAYDTPVVGWEGKQINTLRLWSARTNEPLRLSDFNRGAVDLMERLLPRHMQIIFEINARHLALVADPRGIAAVSLIDETHGRRVRMGNLTFVGSHKINRVSALHSDLVRRLLFADLDAIYPDRIVSKTNGITFRRWLHRANRPRVSILTDVLGERVLSDQTCLQESRRGRVYQAQLPHQKEIKR